MFTPHTDPSSDELRITGVEPEETTAVSFPETSSPSRTAPSVAFSSESPVVELSIVTSSTVSNAPPSTEIAVDA